MYSSNKQSFSENALARNSAWMFCGQGLSVICQGVYFVLLARLLGATEYGVYVGAFALVSILSQYSALGSHSVFLRYVSAKPSLFPEYWGNVLLTTGCLGLTFAGMLAVVAPLVSHSYPAAFLLCLAVSDSLFAQISVAAGRVFQAFERMRTTATLTLLSNFLRMVAAGSLVLLIHRTGARNWAWAILAVSATTAIVAVTLVWKSFGRPQFSLNLLRRRSGEGFIFALSYSTTGIYNDIDKALLGHFGMNMANGIYTMAYRVVDVCTMPLYAVQSAAFPRFFKKGAEAGLKETKAFAMRVVAHTAPLSLVAAGAMFIMAPVIPYVAGKGFLGSVEALRWLCLLPAFRSLHISAGDALTGSGHQKLRLTTQAVAAGFNLAVNLYLIPRFGWLGAAWSSLATDGALGMMNWVVLLVIERRCREQWAKCETAAA